MTDQQRIRYLQVALIAVGLIFLVGVYPLTLLWPAGWAWNPAQPDYLQMIVGIYATLGVFLLLAARNPLAHRSLIEFTIWSSVVHGGIMGVQSILDPTDRGHLFGDVPALLLVALTLWILLPRGHDAATQPV